MCLGPPLPGGQREDNGVGWGTDALGWYRERVGAGLVLESASESTKMCQRQLPQDLHEGATVVTGT